MAGQQDAPAEEIVIVRRRHAGEDEGHHGGVWKIAYADFMTAMMAFFLVMWLINAANTETKARVASYFNPIKLMDNSFQRKGLHDFDQKAISPEKHAGDPGKAADRSKAQASSKADDNGQPGAAPAPIAERRDASGAAGRAFRDPFNPIAPGRLAAGDATAGDGTSSAAAATKSTPSEQRPQDASIPPGQASPAAATSDVWTTETTVADAKPRSQTETAQRLLREIQAAARQIGVTGGPDVDVTVEPDGVVLSLTDTSTFGMFAIGSADPNTELVSLLQGIAPILAANSQRFVVRGHTDSRPFRNDKSNNWRLSMARAEAAYAILARSGIDEGRVERIEAHADRKPKVEKSPGAAANRRIEVLLRTPQP